MQIQKLGKQSKWMERGGGVQNPHHCSAGWFTSFRFSFNLSNTPNSPCYTLLHNITLSMKSKSKKFCFLHFMMQHSTRSAIKINSPRQTKLRYDLLRQSSEAYCISTLNLFRSNWFFVRIGFRSNFFCSNKFQINTSLFE
jgi:hypothetical protein